jgi:hypothetical protein
MPHQLHETPLTEDGEVDLYAPFISDTILEVRTGKMKNMPGLTVQSGIDKLMHDKPVRVTEMGLEGDEHDPTFHGGIDKAIHGCKLPLSLTKRHSQIPTFHHQIVPHTTPAGAPSTPRQPRPSNPAVSARTS